AAKELTVHRNKWGQLHEFEVALDSWMSAACRELDPQAVQAKVDELVKANYKMLKSRKDDAVVTRLKRELDEFKQKMPLIAEDGRGGAAGPSASGGRHRHQGVQVDELVKANYKMLKSRKDDAVVTRLKRELDEFKQKMPLIAEVSNPALEQRHWAQIFAVLGQPFDSETPFCVKDLIGMGVVEQLDQVQVVGATATKEFRCWGYLGPETCVHAPHPHTLTLTPPQAADCQVTACSVTPAAWLPQMHTWRLPRMLQSAATPCLAT
ncbi:dynein heavy chain, partial [Haematococcus lacustris]